MNLTFYAQLSLFEILDVVPFVILAASSFQSRIRSWKTILGFTVILYLLGLVRRSISYTTPSYSAALSILWTIVYLAIYYLVIRQPLSKLLFVLITLLNYASLDAIIYNFAASRLFFERLVDNPYCLEVSLTTMITLAVTFPPTFYWLTRKVAPLMEASENDHLWKTLWLVPTTFYVFFYYYLYSSESILMFSSDTHNFIFALVISAGSFFVLYLVLRLVEMSMLNARLLSEKHQLELHNLQFEHQTERMEETRRARHDMRQLITVLQVYLENGDIANLRGYITQVCSTLSGDASIVYCLYPPLNALVSYYANLAAKQNTLFHAQVNYPGYANIQDTDLVVLFGNLLENAVEACRRQKTGERFIRLNVKKIGGRIGIALDNSFDGEVRKNGDSFYSSKRDGYGIGIVSVCQIAAKYRGTAYFKQEDGVFYASVILDCGDAQ